jgi:uncharacterized protein (TIGR03663 family)
MSTQEPEVQYGTTGERLRAFALNEQSRERLAGWATRYWEIAAYAVIVLTAGVLRFWSLGPRAMHHDESLHGYFSYGFTNQLKQILTFEIPTSDRYTHEPFMHGPFQFIGSGFLMLPFGDGEYQARLLAAIMGTGMVFMPFLLRKQLTTLGALAAAAFVAFSPTLMYFSRFTREDIYTAFWTFGIVIFMWRYLATKETKFLLLTAGFMAGAFATKETTFMTVGAFVLFANFMLAVHIAEHIAAKRPMSSLKHGLLVVGLFPVAWAIAIGWPFLQDWRRQYALDELPAAGVLVIVMGTLAVPQYAAGVQLIPGIFGEEWRNRAGGGGNWNIHPDERTLAFAWVFFLIGASVVIGMLWRPKLWAMAAAAFWVPWVLLYTTFFTNPRGFMSGMWGSLDYWISQQDVRRGDQPDYYYFITIPVYEFLPLILAVAGGIYFAVRGRLQNAFIMAGGALLILALLGIPGAYDPHIEVSIFHVWLPFLIVLAGIFIFRMDMFTRFLLFWLVMTALALTVAGEKMPWLNVHIALPLAVVAGRFLGELLHSSDLREDLPPFERLAPFAYAALAAVLATVVFVVVGPLSLSSFGAWLLVAVAVAAVWWAYTSYSRRTAVQVAVVALVAAVSVFSVRAGVLASFGHADEHAGLIATEDRGDTPVELLVYTQTSQDIPVLMGEIRRVGRESGLGQGVPIVVDSSDGFTWPWAWYLRDYTNVVYQSIGAGFSAEPGTIILAGAGNAAHVSVGGDYARIEYVHRHWFQERYRGADGQYSTHDFFSDLFSGAQLSTWWNYWYHRTTPVPPGSINGVAFFPADHTTFPVTPVGPTVWEDGNQLVMGGVGSADGQLNAPSDVAVDAEGNIYVADTNNNRISKYTPDGEFVAAAGGFGSDIGLNQPWSMAVALDGTVYVADTWNHRVVVLNGDLEEIGGWGFGSEEIGAGTDPERFYGPREIGITIDGNVLLVDTGNKRVIEFTSDGEVVRVIGDGDLTFDEPVGVTPLLDGGMYVADFWNRRVVRLDEEGNLTASIEVPTWGSQAVTDRPYLAVLEDGRLLATDPEHGTIVVFDEDGNELASYEVPAIEGQAQARPVGIAAFGGDVLVVDAAGSVVRKIPLTDIVE